MALSVQRAHAFRLTWFPSLADVFGGLPVRFGSFLPGVDLFDAAAFATSDAEALVLDPQQRLLLEAVGELLLTGAGGSAASGRRDVGVFVGLSTVDYAKASGLCHSMRHATLKSRAT